MSLTTSDESELVSSTHSPRSATSGYFDYPINNRFAEDLSLGKENAVDKVLADIPFFAIGTLAFAVVTYFLAKHRVSKSIFFVSLSAVIGFAAGVVDLGALLTSHAEDIFALLVAREVGYGVSIGLRLMFYWKHCSDAPPGELQALAQARNRRVSTTPGEVTSHSASWARWGKLGLVYQGIIFIASVGVMALQIAWRFCAVFKGPEFTAVYRASSSLLIAVSVMILFKYKGNIYLSPKNPKSKALTLFSPIMLAVFIGIGVAIGDLLSLRFSESCLGRLLQVSELYIIFVYLLLTVSPYESSNESDEDSSSGQRQRNRRDTTESFQGVNIRNSFRTFRITPPLVTTPELLPTPANDPRPSATRQSSTTERFSKWLTQRASGRSTQEDRVRLWNKAEVEKSGQWAQQKTPQDLDLEKSPSRSTPLHSETGHLNLAKAMVVDYKILSAPMPTITPAPAQTNDLISVRASILPPGSSRDMESQKLARPVSIVSSDAAPRESGFSLVKAYEYSRYNSVGEPMPENDRDTSKGANSPIYGLDGILKNLAARDITFEEQASAQAEQTTFGIALGTPLVQDGELSPSIAILRRAQAELDESVAGLQLFSPSSRRASTSTRNTSHTARQGSISLSLPLPPTLPPLIVSSQGSTTPEPPAGAWPLPPVPSNLAVPVANPWPLPPLPNTSPRGDNESSSDPAKRPSTAGQSSLSASVGSDFSLSNFPSPPLETTAFAQNQESSSDRRVRPGPKPLNDSDPPSFLSLETKAEESGSSSERLPLSRNVIASSKGQDRKGKGKDPSEYPSPPKALTHKNSENLSLDGIDKIPFKLAPPRMPAAVAEGAHSRQLSFPSTTRGSDLSGIVLKSPEAMYSTESRDLQLGDRRLDVTSFIGGLTWPAETGSPVSRPLNILSRKPTLVSVEEISNASPSDDRETTKIVRDARLANSVPKTRAIPNFLSSTLRNTSPTDTSNSNLSTTESSSNATPPTSSTVAQPSVTFALPKVASLRTKTPFGLPASPRQQPSASASAAIQGIATGRVVAAARSGSANGRNISSPLAIPSVQEPARSFEMPRPAPVAGSQLLGGASRGVSPIAAGSRSIGRRPF